ncbi:MAG: hypothetical protein EU542_00390 [Promethearchaeota archaeon]|nr:MAG: hypothetical protein EU542_00390 [Candidatus Lokiarchaeota archaeon]
MNTMYCEKCQTNVLTKREDLDVGIIILLFIFTAGLGVLIYLVVYYDKKANRCIHCNSVCKTMLLEYQKGNQLTSIDKNGEKNQNYVSVNKIEEKETKFCYNCGTELDERERKFCPFCGINIE